MARTAHRWVSAAISAVFLIALYPTVASAAFPEKSIRWVVGFPPAGGADVLARLISKYLTVKWHQPMVVFNQPGAFATIAADDVAHSTPDGYTLDVVTLDHVTTPSNVKLGYDPVKNFAAVTILASAPELFVVRADFPAKTFQDMIALARQKPGQLYYGTAGPGPAYLATELLKKQAGFNIKDVEYKGSAAALTALLGGEIQIMPSSPNDTMGMLRAGKVRALGVSTDTRFSLLPDVPTVSEAANAPGYNAANWFAVLAPAGTPKDVLASLQSGIAEAMHTPDAEKYIASQGYQEVINTPDQAQAFLAEEAPKWRDLISDLDKK